MYAIPIVAVLSLAVLLGVIGIVQIAGPRFLRDMYRRWDYSQGTRLVTGLLDIVAAMMILEPSMRGWGIALAAILTFGSVVMKRTSLKRGTASVAGMSATIITITAAAHRYWR